METEMKQYKGKYRKMLLEKKEQNKFFEQMSEVVSRGKGEKVKNLLDVLEEEGEKKMLDEYRENNGESMLHVAAKFNQSSEIIELLIKCCPDLMEAAREQSNNYCGQTPLHILIAKGNTEAVKTLLAEIKNNDKSVKDALHKTATGAKFANTVMMGELPLSVASLTFNSEMIDILQQNGAYIDRQNSIGDTVFHTLIRFAAIYPELIHKVLETMEFLHKRLKENKFPLSNQKAPSKENDHDDYSYVWFIQNTENLNPLQLAAKLSQSSIFQFILNLQHVYCFLNNHDGLFDQKLYDITEIDTVAYKKISNSKTKSILEMMFDIRGSAAYEFIQQPTVRHVIKTKWLYYRHFYYIWALCHLSFMIVLTVFAVFNADRYGNGTMVTDTQTTENEPTDYRTRDFLNSFSYIYLIIGVLYFLHEVIHVLLSVKAFPIKKLLKKLLNVLHNGSYRVALFIFSLSLIIDFILEKSVSEYENITLMIAIVTGWWFMVFFIRAHQKFSFFTVMIQRIIFGDMLRFAIIIALFIIAFTTVIFMAFQGSPAAAEENLDHFGRTMLMLFKLMLGLGDIEVLFEARRPWLAISLFIILVLLTYVLMFNALIAMMSRTCMIVSENRLVQWRVQQLSVIVFFEDILPSCMTKLVGTEKHVKRFDIKTTEKKSEKRYYLDMSSIHTEYVNAEDIYAMKNKLQTLPFGDQKMFSPEFTLTMQSHDFTSSRNQVRFPSTRPASYMSDTPRSTISHHDDIPNFANPTVQVNSAQQSNPEITDNPMLIKPEKSQSNPNIQEYPEDNNIQDTPKPKKRKSKKNRTEPIGETSNEDHIPGRRIKPTQTIFCMDYSHQTDPNFGVQPHLAPIKQQRINLENALMVTHIGQQHKIADSNM